MSDTALLAQASARIRALEAELAALKATSSDTGDVSAALADEQAAHEATKKDRDQVKAELAELRNYLGDPPEGSGVELVHYLDPADGATITKKRYRAEDGEKFKLLPDALHYQAALSVSKGTGVSLEQAKTIVEKRDVVRDNLALADRKTPGA